MTPQKRRISFIFICLCALYYFALTGFAFASAEQKALKVDGRRLEQRLEELSLIGRNQQGGVDRVAFSEANLKAREHVMSLMRELGLKVRIDEAGNISGRREGSGKNLPPILFGSHLDTVPNGGKYDGALGVLAALECIETLEENGVKTRHPLEVVVFSDEEGGTIGSRAMRGEFPPEALDVTSQSGKTIREGVRFLGGDPENLDRAARRPGDIAAFLELHIEQGGILASRKIDIGIVEGIVGISRWEVTIEGASNHAGTTPMALRRDALLAASHLVIAVNKVVTAVPGSQVGTVGKIRVEPGAPNVISGFVSMTVELRDLAEAKVRSLYDQIRREAVLIQEKTGTRISFAELGPPSLPAPTDARIRRCLGEAVRELGLSTEVMPSGAGHDAQNIARIAPMGMIFIPSVGGISHSPQEYSRPEDIEHGTNVLLLAILKIDQGCLEETGPISFF